ncbi:MAG TPA: dihydrolipoamide acetyltransferase family protein [Solirubrobacteraceae bacterium]|nr:dihydrolipoamide acetyltransferase family protein [Solirubrobacteraceae bacterium]
MSDVILPRLSDSMEEGTLIRWLKRDGDAVAAGDELVEVETDKATVTVSAESDGVLAIASPEGSTVTVGTVIGRLGPLGEERDVAPEIPDERPEPPPAVAAPAGSPAHAPGETADTNGHVPATPLARRAAQHHGVELAEVIGTGPRGRITRDDVLSAAGIAPAPTPAAPAPAPAAPAPPPPSPARAAAAADGELQPLTRLQQLIARRMTESRAAIPEFEVQTDVVMDAAVALRAQLREAVGDGAPVPSLNDLVVRACALALRDHPRLNASLAGDAVRMWPEINIGVAVATEGALIVPVVRGADALSLGQIAAETRRLAERVRAGAIGPGELEGGTFTVSNLGMFGMTAIRPVINHPEVAILGVGAVRETLARRDGEIIDRGLMTLTLSADHRAVYGADAARFLAALRDLLQAPLRLVL